MKLLTWRGVLRCAMVIFLLASGTALRQSGALARVGEAGSPATLAITATPQSVTSGGTLTLRVQTEPGARVTITLRVLATQETAAVGPDQGVRQVVERYRAEVDGVADPAGLFVGMLRITYRPAQPVQPLLTVTATTTQGTLTGTAAVTIQPPVSQGSGNLDLALVIDTTGSMVPYITSVQAAAKAITGQILSAAPDSRIAVEAYRDYPVAPYGQSTDYLYQDAQPFTSDAVLIDTAINGLAATGGGDTPESLFCALLHAIRADQCAGYGSATTIGAWRPTANKFIIYMTDAPAHSPEPFTGFTIADVVSAAKSAGLSVRSGVGILPIHVGNDPVAQADATTLANGTGGTVFTSPSPSGAVTAINRAIRVVAPAPDLAVSGTGIRAPGGSLAAQFTVTLTNQGHGVANGMLLRDRVTGASALPTITADSGLQCRHVPARDTAGVYVFDCMGTLQPGKTMTITILAPVESGAPVNIAVADPDHTTGDTDTKNNEVTNTVLVL